MTSRSIIFSSLYFHEISSELPLTVSSTSPGSLVLSGATTLLAAKFSNRWTTVRNFYHFFFFGIVSLDNCIRQEQGFCRIQWQGVDSNFQLDTQSIAAGAVTTGAAGGIIPPPATIACVISYVAIPDGSQDGITPLNAVFSSLPFQTEWCGSVLGYTGQTFATSIVCKSSMMFHCFSIPFSDKLARGLRLCL